MNAPETKLIWSRANARFTGNCLFNPSQSLPEITGQILQNDRISSDSVRIIFAGKSTKLTPLQGTPPKPPVLDLKNFCADFRPKLTRHFRRRKPHGFNLPIALANL